jgi:hypothetical protein
VQANRNPPVMTVTSASVMAVHMPYFALPHKQVIADAWPPRRCRAKLPPRHKRVTQRLPPRR